jgi:fructose-1-phosphate kinase PfkB-like protein
LITDGDQAWICVPAKIKEINPVGAGDAMVAGLTRSFYIGNDLLTSLKWGVACGTAAAMQSGTKMPEKAIVEEVFHKVTVKEG